MQLGHAFSSGWVEVIAGPMFSGKSEELIRRVTRAVIAKQRVQVFRGTVIKRHRAGTRGTFTVRKVSFNIGVERIFVTHSPRIEKVELVSRGVVRRGRLFYLRDLSGKAARIKDAKDR